MGYLGSVLNFARRAWRINVPPDVIMDAKEAMKLLHLTGKAN